MIKTDRFKDGKQHIVTMSYDDGPDTDRRLIEIFNKYGIKGTFHLISGNLGQNPTGIQWDELTTLYAGHEIASHTVTHPHLELMPIRTQYEEIYDCKRALEEKTGMLVRGLSYPFGTWNEETILAMKNAGIEYSRTTKNTDSFVFPTDFMEWHPTCHHSTCERHVNQLIHNIEKCPWRVGSLLYIWGHSYEFRNDNNWELIEGVCAKLSQYQDKIWFATNIEVVDYRNAMKQLRVSADSKILMNPTAIDLWVSVDGVSTKIPAGETVHL